MSETETLYQREEVNIQNDSKISDASPGIFELIMIVFAYIFGTILFPFTTYMIKEYERGIYFRNGRCKGSVGPGLVTLLPFVNFF
jgi:regulator of protease activity HflC (stomatin/prohibitin superfamily)